MIGFRSVQHHGFIGARTNSSKPDEDHNPYPKGCAAFYEYQDGCNAWRRGGIINCRGDVASHEASRRLPNENNFRHAAEY